MEIENLFTLAAHEEGAEMQVHHPVTGDPTDVFIRMVGVDSKAFRSLARIRNRLRFTEVDREGKATQESQEQAEARDLDMLVDATLGWRGLTQEGQELPFTKENCRRLYEQSPAIRSQVDTFILNRRNFTKG